MSGQSSLFEDEWQRDLCTDSYKPNLIDNVYDELFYCLAWMGQFWAQGPNKFHENDSVYLDKKTSDPVIAVVWCYYCSSLSLHYDRVPHRSNDIANAIFSEFIHFISDLLINTLHTSIPLIRYALV